MKFNFLFLILLIACVSISGACAVDADNTTVTDLSLDDSQSVENAIDEENNVEDSQFEDSAASEILAVQTNEDDKSDYLADDNSGGDNSTGNSSTAGLYDLINLINYLLDARKANESNNSSELVDVKPISESDYWNAHMESLKEGRYDDFDYYITGKSNYRSVYFSHDYDDPNVFNFDTYYHRSDYADRATFIKIYDYRYASEIVTIDGCGHTLNGRGEKRLFYVYKYWGWSFILRNTNIVNGYNDRPMKIPGCDGKGFGGAVLLEVQNDNYVCFENCTFKNNWAGQDGGAIFQGPQYEAPTLTFRNCNFINNTAKEGNGGAIYTMGKVILYNCVFDSNTAGDLGGAIYAGDVEIHNCTFINNQANEGGAIYCFGSNKEVKVNPNQMITSYDTFFINNKAKNNKGGAIYCEGKVTTMNAVFKGNEALVDGGAIYSEKDVSTTHTLYESNKANGATYSRCWGGAIRAEGNVKVDRSNFTNNYAENSGGAIYADTVSFAYSKSYFTGNTAYKASGGAIYANRIETGVNGVEFMNNRAGVISGDHGGAIYINSENNVIFSNCVFVKNSCSDKGGAIYLDSKYSHLSLTNNIFEDNTAKEGQSVYSRGYYDTIRNNYWSINPSKDNDQLIEWKAILSNVHHSDSSPMVSKPKADLPPIRGPTIRVITGPSINVSNTIKSNMIDVPKIIF